MKLLNRLRDAGIVDRIFLITPTTEYRYRDLIEYIEEEQNTNTGSVEPLVMLQPELRKEDLFRLAAYFLTGTPVMLFPPGSSNSHMVEAFHGLLAQTNTTDPKEIAAYLFTSGTTSFSKCVPIRYSQVEAASSGAKSQFAPDANKAWLLNLPLFHVGGLSILYRALVWQTAVYLPESRQIEETASLLANEHRIQTVSLVFTQWKRLLDRRVQPHSEMKAILLGGGPIPDSYLTQLSAQKRALPPLFTSYGMTETFAMVSYKDLRDSEILGNAGATLPNQKARINSEGEIELKGNQLFKGYLPLPDHPAPIHPFTEDGWFRTGDFGSIQPDGSLHIRSRRTDLIVSGGKNIVPQEVEQVLAELPYVKEVAVTGTPDEEWGEIVVALIELAPGAASNFIHKTEAELIHEIRLDAAPHLQRYQLPKRVLVVEEIPRTLLGKLKRSELRELAIELAK